MEYDNTGYMKLFSKLKTAARVILATKNWVAVFVSAFLLKKDVDALFRNGTTFHINGKTWGKFNSYTSFLRHFPDGEIDGSIAKIKYNSKELYFDFGDTAPGAFAEFFGKHFPYEIKFDVSEVRGRVVIDVGAYFGDSTIWVAVHEAKKVYAFEPLTTYYNLCKHNIELNGFGDVCEVTQAAIAGKKGGDFFEVESEQQLLGLGGELKSEYKENVRIFTLDEVVKMHGIQSGAFLKMDCEGYEYDVILNASNETLAPFDFIMMEYHYGYEKLKTKLEEAGFSVKYTKPERVLQSSVGEGSKEMAIGYIFASRERAKRGEV